MRRPRAAAPMPRDGKSDCANIDWPPERAPSARRAHSIHPLHIESAARPEHGMPGYGVLARQVAVPLRVSTAEMILPRMEG
jgi:hypothetical protein